MRTGGWTQWRDTSRQRTAGTMILSSTPIPTASSSSKRGSRRVYTSWTRRLNRCGHCNLHHLVLQMQQVQNLQTVLRRENIPAKPSQPDTFTGGSGQERREGPILDVGRQRKQTSSGNHTTSKSRLLRWTLPSLRRATEPSAQEVLAGRGRTEQRIQFSVCARLSATGPAGNIYVQRAPQDEWNSTYTRSSEAQSHLG
jgi:hypothetical protein